MRECFGNFNAAEHNSDREAAGVLPAVQGPSEWVDRRRRDGAAC